ncbi:hypothetical protein ACQP0C_23225 [Nocardia sp. CA-129566]|uniref:hypothetical protein n=1 Tax=Nocardia sp. CA-129566 TaxID=3239976 RepID=UPI003D990EDA
MADNRIAQSMGSVGDSYDIALMENFFTTPKTELVYRNSWRTREDAENALFAIMAGTTPSASRRSWIGNHRTSSKPIAINEFQPDR